MIAFRTHGLTKEQTAEIARLYSEGEPMRRLRSLFGVGSPTIRAALAAHGVEERAERWTDDWVPTPEELAELRRRKAQVRCLWSPEVSEERWVARSTHCDWTGLFTEDGI